MDLPENKLRVFIQGNGQEKWKVDNNHNIRYFTEIEIKEITNNYSIMIGKGGFGEVYRGSLDGYGLVAVKRYIVINEIQKGEFAKEVIVHSQINHKNVVRLLGCCVDVSSLVMVTEYICNGNLNEYLHSGTNISLDTRLSIAIDCAEALSYMHSSMYRPILHSDIKPANILLDENYTAKISDFGISRLLCMDNTQYTMLVKGSIGYMDPVFSQTGLLTQKSDVYSFGVVLLELITRRKAIDDANNSLVQNFIQATSKRKRLREIFDAEITEDSNNLKTIDLIGKLALECLVMQIDKRPDMNEVADRLRTYRKARNLLQRKQVEQPKQNKVTLKFALASREPLYLPAMGVSLDDMSKLGKLLGSGALGSTYKFTLHNGEEVIVKRMKHLGFSSEVEFKERVAKISAIRHMLIVPLRGYCFTDDEILFIYGYMPKGSLAALLHENGSFRSLDYRTRSAIALNVAHAIAYIHLTSPMTSHGNIKASNVLLSKDLDARMSDCCLHLAVQQPVSGTGSNGGRDQSTGTTVRHVTQEDDVFNFGQLLFELLTGEAPSTCTVSGGDLELVEWAHKFIDFQGWVRQMLPDWTPSRNQRREVARLLKIALHCTAPRHYMRPTMAEVVKSIERIVTQPSADSKGTSDDDQT